MNKNQLMASAIKVLFVILVTALSNVCARASVLDDIRTSGEIKLGYVADAAPFSSVDASGEPQGYSIDLCREIAAGIEKQLGLSALKSRWVALTVQNRLTAITSRRVDIECSTTTWTLRRQREVEAKLAAGGLDD